MRTVESNITFTMASDDVLEKDGIAPSPFKKAEGAGVVEKDPSSAGRDQVQRHQTTDRVIQGAKTATEKEQKMTLMQGIKLYPKAIAWSILISTCIVMEGTVW